MQLQSIFIVGAVVGFTQFVKSAFDRDYRTCVIITGAAAIGALAGFLAIEGVDVPTGIVLGLAASGAITGLQSAGGRAISKE